MMVSMFDNAPATSFAKDAQAVASTNVDWKETATEHVFKADLPGLRKEDVKGIHVYGFLVTEIKEHISVAYSCVSFSVWCSDLERLCVTMYDFGLEFGILIGYGWVLLVLEVSRKNFLVLIRSGISLLNLQLQSTV